MAEKITHSDLFARAAKKLRQDFEELASVPHSGLKGQAGEAIIKTFLREHLPKRFEVAGGFVVDPKNEVSRQADVVVYDALNCPVYRASDEAGIFPSDNVAAVIEVKSKLDKKQLDDAGRKIASVKKLSKLKAEATEELYTAQTLGCVFAFSSSLKLETLLKHYRDQLVESGIGWHIDVICVLDLGVLHTAIWQPDREAVNFILLETFGGPKDSVLGVASSEVGEHSLDTFYRFLLIYLSRFREVAHLPGFPFDNPAGNKQVLFAEIAKVPDEYAKSDIKSQDYSDFAQKKK